MLSSSPVITDPGDRSEESFLLPDQSMKRIVAGLRASRHQKVGRLQRRRGARAVVVVPVAPPTYRCGRRRSRLLRLLGPECRRTLEHWDGSSLNRFQRRSRAGPSCRLPGLSTTSAWSSRTGRSNELREIVPLRPVSAARDDRLAALMSARAAPSSTQTVSTSWGSRSEAPGAGGPAGSRPTRLGLRSQLGEPSIGRRRGRRGLLHPPVPASTASVPNMTGRDSVPASTTPRARRDRFPPRSSPLLEARASMPRICTGREPTRTPSFAVPSR